MTDKNFTIKSGLQVNSIFTVDPTTGQILATGANVVVGNVLVTQSDMTIGNSTVNSYSNSSLTSTSTGNFILGANVGANVNLTTSGFQIGNSTVNVSANSSLIKIGNLTTNSSALFVGNSTINLIANSSLLQIGNATINATTLKIGNSTIFTTINATAISGTILQANNASNLGGVAASGYELIANLPTDVAALTSNNSTNLNGQPASNYLTTSVASATYQTLGGLSANVVRLTSNNATNLNGQAASFYLAFGNFSGVVAPSQINSSATYSVGAISASGNVTAVNIIGTTDVIAGVSDGRLKDIDSKIDNALDIVEGMTGYRYHLRSDIPNLQSDDRMQVGLIAQDVFQVLHEVVCPAPFDVGSDGESISGKHYMTIQYEKIVPVLVEAIKELRREVAELRSAK